MIRNNELRRDILKYCYSAGACHLGSALSCVDIIDDIYMKKKKEDLFIFSKASGVAAFLVVLVKHKIIPKSKIVHYLKHYPLPSKEVPGVIWSGGSLGHGLPFAVGLALANRKRKVYVLLGDSEIQCGTTWESILFAKHHSLKNLKIYVDRNELQALGKTEDILGIDKALKLLKQLFPIKVVKTIKGKGWEKIEGKVEGHYCNITKKELRIALKKLS